MRLRPLLPALSLGLLLAGCGDDSLPADAVRLTNTVQYLGPAGEVTRAESMDGGVELLVPGEGGYTRLAVTEEEPGEAVVRNVPEDTPFLVRFGTRYVQTSAREVELGTFVAGRPDVARTETTVASASLNVTGLQPWNEAGYDESFMGFGREDQLLVYSAETDSLGLFEPASMPTTGATELRDAEGQLQGLSGRPLPRLSSQDVLRVSQLSLRRTTTADGEQPLYTSVGKAAVAPAPTFTGTETFVLNATLQDVPQRSVRVDFRGTEFAALVTGVHPQATAGGTSLDIYPAVPGLAHGWVDFAGWLLTYPQLDPRDVVATFEYGNPFPAPSAQVAEGSASFNLRVTLPGGSTGQVWVSAFSRDTAERLLASPVAPRLTAPRNVRVDGAAATAARTLAGRAPVLSWEAPATGTPSFYELTIHRMLPPTSGSGSATRRTAARLRLPATTRTLQLPEGILESGGHYVVSVAAEVAEGWEARPMGYGFPTAHAEALTGLLTAP